MRKHHKVPFYVVAGPTVWQIEEHIKKFLDAGVHLELQPEGLTFYLAHTEMGRATHRLQIRLFRILRQGEKDCPKIELGPNQFVTRGHVDPPPGSNLDEQCTAYLLLNTASSTSTGKLLQAHQSTGRMIVHERVLRPL